MIIETDEGESVLIRKLNGATSAMLQQFDIVSTNMAEKAAVNGSELQPRAISTEALAGVVVVPGLPMRLGFDPNTGLAPKTYGNVTRITGLLLNESGEVQYGHPDLARPEKVTDARDRFNDAIRSARSTVLASAAIDRST